MDHRGQNPDEQPQIAQGKICSYTKKKTPGGIIGLQPVCPPVRQFHSIRSLRSTGPTTFAGTPCAHTLSGIFRYILIDKTKINQVSFLMLFDYFSRNTSHRYIVWHIFYYHRSPSYDTAIPYFYTRPYGDTRTYYTMVSYTCTPSDINVRIKN